MLIICIIYKIFNINFSRIFNLLNARTFFKIVFRSLFGNRIIFVAGRLFYSENLGTNQRTVILFIFFGKLLNKFVTIAFLFLISADKRTFLKTCQNKHSASRTAGFSHSADACTKTRRYLQCGFKIYTINICKRGRNALCAIVTLKKQLFRFFLFCLEIGRAHV